MRCVTTLDYAVTSLACEDDGPSAGQTTTGRADFGDFKTPDLRPPMAAIDPAHACAQAHADCQLPARSETVTACCAQIDFVVEALMPRHEEEQWREEPDGSLVAYDCIEIVAPSESVMQMSFRVESL